MGMIRHLFNILGRQVIHAHHFQQGLDAPLGPAAAGPGFECQGARDVEVFAQVPGVDLPVVAVGNGRPVGKGLIQDLIVTCVAELRQKGGVHSNKGMKLIPAF